MTFKSLSRAVSSTVFKNIIDFYLKIKDHTKALQYFQQLTLTGEAISPRLLKAIWALQRKS
eukprot:Awhi_evm1s6564